MKEHAYTMYYRGKCVGTFTGSSVGQAKDRAVLDHNPTIGDEDSMNRVQRRLYRKGLKAVRVSQ